MSSQLNPNAAEFVPVSPTRLLLLDEAIISASTLVKSVDSLPTEKDFNAEISQRPGDLDYMNGPKHCDNYFMRDNFSSLHNKAGGIFNASTCAELGKSSVLSCDSSTKNSAASLLDIPFDKLEAVQSIEEKVTSGVLERENMFGENNQFTNPFETNNIFSKPDPMTTSVMGAFSPEVEELTMPGSPKSTGVEAPVSPSSDDISPLNQQMDLESPADEFTSNVPKSPGLMSPVEDQVGLEVEQQNINSSGFKSDSDADEEGTNSADDNEGFKIEHRRSPPMDLRFKPIQNFSDTNPFGALQTPSATTPLNHCNLVAAAEDLSMETLKTQEGETNAEPVAAEFAGGRMTQSSIISIDDELETSETMPKTPEKETITDTVESVIGGITPSSIISISSTEDALETSEAMPKTPEKETIADTVEFVIGGMTPSSFIANIPTEYVLETSEAMPKTPEKETITDTVEFVIGGMTPSSFISLRSPGEVPVPFEELESPTDPLQFEHPPNANSSVVETELPKSDDSRTFVESVDDLLESFQNSRVSHVDLDTTEQFMVEESKILQDEQECEQISKKEDEIKINLIDSIELSEPKIVSHGNTAFEDVMDEVESVIEIHEEKEEPEFEAETKEMKLEFESHIASPTDSSPEELKNLDEDFEVISKDELVMEDDVQITQNETDNLPKISLDSNQTNPFADGDFSDNFGKNKAEEPVVKKDFLNAVEQFDSSVEEPINCEQIAPLSSVAETVPSLEPEVTKVVSYQTLVPADEPKMSKSEAYVTGIEELPQEQLVVEETVKEIETEVPVVDVPVVAKTEPLQSQVVTETLITALEEKSEIPTTEAAGTPPPTPTPASTAEADNTQKTDLLAAAVAAAGAVALGSTVAAVVTDKEVKKSGSAPAKKPVAGVAKKPEATTKAPTKAPVAKTAPTKTTTTAKPASTATKVSSVTAATKPTTGKPATTLKPAAAPAKPSATAAKPAPPKPATAAANKPLATTATKPGATAAAKQVPKQLSVNKTMAPSLKPSSKPSTPTSKPTTPTTPKSPLIKAEVKTSPKPAARSSLATTRPNTAPAKSLADKKPLTNGEAKPITKKLDEVKKPSVTATKPTSMVSATKPSITKTTAPAKTQISATKTVPAKTTTTTAAAKPKPPAPAASKPAVPPPIRRPTTAPAAKAVEKNGTVNKTTPPTKPAVSGKTATAKPAVGVKKTDIKVNGKTSPGKPSPIKKPQEANIKKEEENEPKVQVDNVTTTNGFAEHINEENGIMKIEDLAQVLVDGVN